MHNNASSTEYAEETIQNLRFLAKGLSELLLDRGCLDTEVFRAMMVKHLAENSNHMFVTIPMACAHCGHKGFDRLGEDVKCMYCGGKLRFNLNDPEADDVLSTLDAVKLFSYSVKPSDISDDEIFVRFASGSVTPTNSYNSDSSSDDYGRMCHHEKEQDNTKIIRSQDTVANHQYPVNRLCHSMASIWEMLSRDHPEIRSGMLRAFLTIDESKKQHLYDSLYLPAECTNCHTDGQWPASLFFSACSVCQKPLPLKLSPGFLQVLAVPGSDGTAGICVRNRKLEYLYTLFEAIFSCASSTYGITLEDLMHKINETSSTLAFENTKHVCSKCQRQINFSSSPSGSCPYCKGRLFSSFWEQFL